MKIIKITTYFFIACAPFSSLSWADAPMTGQRKTVSDLRTAVFEALHYNPELLFQRSEKEASSHKITQSVGAYLPSIDLRAGAGKEYLKQSYSRNNLSLGEIRGRINKTRYDPSITLNQKIFDGLETVYDIEKSRKEFFQSTKNVEEAENIVTFDVLEKYISVRRFERLIRLSKKNVKAHQSILSKIKKLVKGGQATSADAKSVQSRLSDAEAAVGDIQGDLDMAYANFKEVIGAEAYKLRLPYLNHSLVPVTVQKAVKNALQTNYSIRVARATEDIARAEFNKSVSPFLPSFDLQLQAKRNYNVGGKSGVETDLTGQIIGTFNLFNGGRDIGRRRELRAKLRSAKFRKQKERARTEKEVRVSYAELLSAQAQSKALRVAVKAKGDVRNIYIKQFEAGTRNFLDILDSIHEYFLAKGSLITSDATADLSEARLLAAMGMLLNQFEGQLPSTLNETHKLKLIIHKKKVPQKTKKGISQKKI